MRRQLNDFIKEQIIALSNEEKSIRVVATQLNCSKSTVARIIKNGKNQVL